LGLTVPALEQLAQLCALDLVEMVGALRDYRVPDDIAARYFRERRG
jgi:hypothetical protein